MPALKKLDGVRVNIDRVVYMPTLEAPPERPHPFVYFITIANGSAATITIKGRKWVIRDGAGRQTTVIEGDGVVGKKPKLGPGEQFSYNSYHAVAGDSLAEGSFLAVCDDGTPVVIPIPPFALTVPGRR